MNNVLACSKFSSEGIHVAKAAIRIAKRTNGDVFLMNLKNAGANLLQPVMAGTGTILADEEEYFEPEEFMFQAGYENGIPHEVPLTYIGDELGGLARCADKAVSLVVTCNAETLPGAGMSPAAPFRKLECPVLSLPQGAVLESLKKIVYVTDLRYLDMALYSPFIELVRPFAPEILVVHSTANGLPDIEDGYAERLFSEQIVPRLRYRNFTLINLPGRDLQGDIDNVTEVMKPDMLVIGSRIHDYYERLYGDGRQPGSFARLPLVLFN